MSEWLNFGNPHLSEKPNSQTFRSPLSPFLFASLQLVVLVSCSNLESQNIWHSTSRMGLWDIKRWPLKRWKNTGRCQSSLWSGLGPFDPGWRGPELLRVCWEWPTFFFIGNGSIWSTMSFVLFIQTYRIQKDFRSNFRIFSDLVQKILGPKICGSDHSNFWVFRHPKKLRQNEVELDEALDEARRSVGSTSSVPLDRAPKWYCIDVYYYYYVSIILNNIIGMIVGKTTFMFNNMIPMSCVEHNWYYIGIILW